MLVKAQVVYYMNGAMKICLGSQYLVSGVQLRSQFTLSVQIVSDKRWKEVTATFNFPSKATNASFMLHKHYFSLLHHYEQVYYFQTRGWAPIPNAIYQSSYNNTNCNSWRYKLIPTSTTTSKKAWRIYNSWYCNFLFILVFSIIC